MSTPFFGEIRILPYVRGAPSGWHVCDGSLLAISDYEPLYTLLGTTYGGDGRTTFGIPDLRDRVPVHQGQGTGLTQRQLGATGGEEAVTLAVAQMGPHSHTVQASTAEGSRPTPEGSVLATIPAELKSGFYATNFQAAVPFPAATVQPAGGGGGHDNTAPTLTLQYCIATEGVWPAQP